MRICLKAILVLVLCATTLRAQEKDVRAQSLDDLKVTKERFATVEVISNHGTRTYHLDNTGEVEEKLRSGGSKIITREKIIFTG